VQDGLDAVVAAFHMQVRHGGPSAAGQSWYVSVSSAVRVVGFHLRWSVYACLVTPDTASELCPHRLDEIPGRALALRVLTLLHLCDLGVRGRYGLVSFQLMWTQAHLN